LPTQKSFSGFCCCADSARSAALVSIAAASYHIYLLHRILPEALFDRANPATFTAPLPVEVSVASGLLSGILAYQLQRRIMLGQRLWAGLSRLGDYLRHLLSGRQGVSFGSAPPLASEQQRSRVSP